MSQTLTAEDAASPEDSFDHGSPRAALTLSRLLQERILRNGRTVGNRARGDRPVTWCLSWEQVAATGETLEDILVYVRADQLEEAVVRTLRHRDAAGLVIAGEPPEPVLGDLAGDFLLVVIGEGIGYREINRLVAELSLARETHVLRYGQTVHRSLAELLYRGAGLEALCHRLARLTGCAAAILDSQRRLMAFVAGRVPQLQADEVAAALADHLPEVPPEGAGQEHYEHGPSVWVLRLRGSTVTGLTQPIVLGGRHDGWVALLEPTLAPHPHDLAEHRVVVEQAVTIVGTEMLRLRGIEQAEERARGDFVHALLHGRFSNRHDLEARAAHYDVRVDACFGVVVAAGVGPGGAESLNELFALAREVTVTAARSETLTLATVVGDVLAVIRQVEPAARADAADAATKVLADYAGTLERTVGRRLRHPVAVAYGRPVSGAGQIFDSYREARITLALRNKLELGTVCGFQDLRVYATLADLAGTPQGRRYATEMLEPLRSSRAGAGDLAQSVQAYIAAGGNVNAAARELHIHRNTMLYKLERASRILHLDLRAAEHQFALWLAYKLDLLAETTAAVDRDVKPT
jgi:sugar diacid utilization regulator